MMMQKMRRYYAFRANKVFAVNSFRLPIKATHIADFVFQMDDFGTLYSTKNRVFGDGRIYENISAVIRHLERQGRYFNIEDGIPLISDHQLEEKLLNATNDHCDRGCCSRACPELGNTRG